MKITRNSLKELIRQSIDELKEGGPGSGKPKGGKPDSISASDWKKMDADEKEYHTSGQYDKDSERDDTGNDDVPYTDDDENHGGFSEGGPGSGRPKGDDEPFDSGGPSYANVPKGAKTSKQAKEMSKKKKEKTEESVSRRVTVKEVKKWFKTLEENRYKKTYASDARRVSWMVNNNLSEDYEAMPVSMKKKWPKAAYKRERFLAREFVKHLKGETKLRESIRRIIKGLIND